MYMDSEMYIVNKKKRFDVSIALCMPVSTSACSFSYARIEKH